MWAVKDCPCFRAQSSRPIPSVQLRTIRRRLGALRGWGVDRAPGSESQPAPLLSGALRAVYAMTCGGGGQGRTPCR